MIIGKYNGYSRVSAEISGFFVINIWKPARYIGVAVKNISDVNLIINNNLNAAIVFGGYITTLQTSTCL